MAKYLGCKRNGKLLFVSGRVSDLRGEVGTEITTVDAKRAARDTVVLILSIVKQDIADLDRIAGVLKVQGFIRSSPTFTDHPHVLDGASELLIEVFGENGQHARTATGVAQLPFGAGVDPASHSTTKAFMHGPCREGRGRTTSPSPFRTSTRR